MIDHNFLLVCFVVLYTVTTNTNAICEAETDAFYIFVSD